MLFNRTNLNNLTGIYWHIIKQHRQQQQQLQPQYQKQPSTTIFNEREGETKSSFQLPTYHSNIKLQLFEQTTNHDARTARKFSLKKNAHDIDYRLEWWNFDIIRFDTPILVSFPGCFSSHTECLLEHVLSLMEIFLKNCGRNSGIILSYICPVSLQSMLHS